MCLDRQIKNLVNAFLNLYDFIFKKNYQMQKYSKTSIQRLK